MDAVFTKICFLVTAAFALTVLPWGFKHSKGSLLVARNRGSALVVFLVLGLVEEASGWRNPWLNERIVTVCTAGLVAGPLVGLVVSVFVTRLAGEWLEMSVNDDGPGASSSEVEQVFFAAGPRVHACRSCVDDWKNCLVALFGWKSVVNWAKGLKLRCAFLFSNAESRQIRSCCAQNLRGEFPAHRLPTSLFLEAMALETVQLASG